MKVHIKFISLALLMLFFISCDSKKSEKSSKIESSEEEVVAEDLHQGQVAIKGMTCEIGCARLIQSKLYKADGINYENVSFADSSGVIRFDQNRISEDEIKEIIQRTAGGDIYTVASIEEVALSDDILDIQ